MFIIAYSLKNAQISILTLVSIINTSFIIQKHVFNKLVFNMVEHVTARVNVWTEKWNLPCS